MMSYLRLPAFVCMISLALLVLFQLSAQPLGLHQTAPGTNPVPKADLEGSSPQTLALAASPAQILGRPETLPDLNSGREATALETPPQTQLQLGFGQMPLYFIENRGQFKGDIAYYLQGREKSLYFTPQGIIFTLSSNKARGGTSVPLRWNLSLKFLGAEPGIKPVGQVPHEATVSYFRGTPDQHLRGLPAYQKLVYRDLWPGIDLVYAGTMDRLKYEFVVKPGADPAQIRLAYEGATEVSLKASGQLEVSTPASVFQDEKPYSYQLIEDRQVAVPTAYALEAQTVEGRYTYSFHLGDYDASLPLIIDPVMLIYAGYIGGTSEDYGRGIAVDHLGYAYILGDSPGPLEADPENGPPTRSPQGQRDIFVAKIKADGTGLVYLNYLGGTEEERGGGITVDHLGQAYITGLTHSLPNQGFPVKVGPDLTANGTPDAFVAKLATDGRDLIYSGYIGGSRWDEGIDIALDSAGNAYIMGDTLSEETTFPVTGGPGLIYQSPEEEIFVAKVNAAGTGLVYAGYIGAPGEDYAGDIAVDADGHAYVTGYTFGDETVFPVLVGPDLTKNGGWDAFVAKVRADGTGLVYAGYIGGAKEDRGNGIAVDQAGNAYVTGITESDQTSFPVQGGPSLFFNYTNRTDGYIAKVKADGTGLAYAGYLGGIYFDVAQAVAVDPLGQAYVTGDTQSNDFPVVGGFGFPSHQHNAFITKVKADGSGFIYSSSLGAEIFGGNDIALDRAGNAYIITGHDTTTESFPTVVGPDLTGHGAYDVLVAKMQEQSLRISKTGPTAAASGKPITYTLTLNNVGSLTMTNLVITDVIPDGAHYLRGGTQVGRVVSWTLPALPVGGSHEVTYVVTTTQTITNGLYGVKADGGHRANGSPPVSTVVGPVLFLTKSAPAVVNPSQPFTYTLTLANRGLDPAFEVVVTDTLPSNTTYWSGGSREGEIIVWNLHSLPPQSTVELTFTVSATQDVVNQVYQASAQGGYSATGRLPIFTIVTSTGSFTGAIIAADTGLPLANILVEAYRFNLWQWDYAGLAVSDAGGQYLLDHLISGTYRVYFADPSGNYAPEYYDDSSSFNTTDILVKADQIQANINAILDPALPPKTEVSGSVSVWTDPKTGLVHVSAWPGSQMILTHTITCAGGQAPIGASLLVGTVSFSMAEVSAETGRFEVTLNLPEDLPQPGFHPLQVRWQCAGQPRNEHVGQLFIRFYDPSGQITDAATGQPVAGATVSLYRVPDAQPDTPQQIRNCRTVETRIGEDWTNEPVAQFDTGVYINPDLGLANGMIEINPAINPQKTGSDGRYAWDVVLGCWYVVVQAPNYKTKVSPVVGVPPEVTDLNLKLQPLGLPPNAPAAVILTGPVAGKPGTSYTFTITVSPGQTTLPLSYTWRASNQPPHIMSGSGLTNVMSYTWISSGTKRITVTASNASGAATGNYLIKISKPGARIFLPVIHRR